MSRSGALKEIIEWWQKVVTKNEYGELNESWIKVKDVRAYVYHNSGRQVIDNDEVFDEIKLRLRIRKQISIKEQDRIKYNGNFYLIDFIQPDDTHRWLTLHTLRINE